MGITVTSGPSSSAKNVMELYVMVAESAWLGSARVRKSICVGLCVGGARGEIDHSHLDLGRMNVVCSKAHLGLMLLEPKLVGDSCTKATLGWGCPMWPLRRLSQHPDRGDRRNLMFRRVFPPIGKEPEDPHKSGKAPYRPIHTGPIADRYANRAVPLKSTVGDRFRLISTVDGRLTEKSTVGGQLKKKKGKEEEKKKEEVPGRRPHLHAAHAPSPPAGRPQAVAARGSPARRCRPRSPRASIVPARGDEMSPRVGRDRGDAYHSTEEHYNDRISYHECSLFG
ncbi:hypothetical protein BHM03_00014069 [Ensete ventricosum]|uniref:Uncharacterized protein n=1 Tax=Ensete ventricosum TaxID=4639 RepID=A0A445MDY7_ENSVE|nr:hypothetical protein BHM03_00014069 [Ensete ventricosum]